MTYCTLEQPPIIKPDESEWETCPKCGEPVDPFKGRWITELPDQKTYHSGCIPRGKLLKYVP